MNLKEIKEALSIIVDAYPTFQVTSSRVKLWLEQLSDIPSELAMGNLMDHIKNNKFPPTIFDLREGYTPPRELTDDEIYMQNFVKEMYPDGIPDGY